MREHRKNNPFALLCNQARDRARKKGLEHTITPEDVARVDNDVCPYLNIPLEWGQGRGVRMDNSKSLDRIDSSRGYTPDNIIVCSWRANRMLSDFTADEMLIAASSFFRILNSTKPNETTQATDRR